MEMPHIASKLKALKLELSEDFLVHLVLISLPTQYSQFNVSDNCQKETWSLNELISHCVQEEERLKHDETESAHLSMASKDKGKKRKKTTKVAVPEPQKKHKKDENLNGCYFCGYEGHVKKHCTNYHAWSAKKGMLLSLVCSRYGYLYLIHDKSQSLDVFKNYKAEDENQLNKRIKSAKSDRGGEYYGIYDGSGEQRPGCLLNS